MPAFEPTKHANRACAQDAICPEYIVTGHTLHCPTPTYVGEKASLLPVASVGKSKLDG